MQTEAVGSQSTDPVPRYISVGNVQQRGTVIA